MTEGSRDQILTVLVTRRSALVVTCAASAAALAYAAYRVYTHEGIARILKTARNAYNNYAHAHEAFSCTCALVATDLQTFLTSGATEVPHSFNQASTLLQSPEVQTALEQTVQTVVRSAAAANPEPPPSDEPGTKDRLIEAMLSDRGQVVLSNAVGIATAKYCEYLERSQAATNASGSSQQDMSRMISLLATEQGEKVVSMVVTKSVRAAVTAYVEGYLGYNIYDDMVAAIVKQEHREAFTDVMTRVTASFCREAAVAYRKTKQSPANGGAHGGGRSSGAADSMVGTGISSQLVISEVPLATTRTSVDVPPGANASRSNSITSPAPGAQHGGGGAQNSKNAASKAAGALSSAAPAPAQMPVTQTVWLRQVVDLVREQDVRALMVDVVRSATGEATRGVVETLMHGPKGATMEVGRLRVGYLPNMSPQHLYIMLTMLVALFMYAVSPRTIEV